MGCGQTEVDFIGVYSKPSAAYEQHKREGHPLFGLNSALKELLLVN